MPPSAVYRSKARQALRGNWQAALLITFSAGIFDVILSVIQLRSTLKMPSSARFLDIVSEGQSQIAAFEPLRLIFFVLSFLFSSALAIGMYNYYLHLQRGQETPYSLLFSRMHILGKCLGQSLLIGLFSLGWGIVVFAPFFLIVLLLQGMHIVLAYIIIIALALLLLLITLRYAMAPYLMADQPEIGVMDSIRESKRMMAGQAGRLFRLQFSFIGWSLLAGAIIYGLRSLSPVMGTVAGLFCSLAINVYMNASITAFYLDFLSE